MLSLIARACARSTWAVQQPGLLEPPRAGLRVRQQIHAGVALPGIDEGLHRRSGIGAGFVSMSGTQAGSVIPAILAAE